MKMDLSRFQRIDFRELRARAKPFSEFRPKLSAIRFSEDDDGGDDDPMLPVPRDTLWRQMLERVLGHVPEGAEKAPPCNCELFPLVENYQFAGLAGLPPAVRLMDGFFPIRDQSKRGACFAFALVALCEYMLGKKVELSEQSLFHFTKLVTPGKVDDVGDGAFTLDAIHAIEEYGICPLSEWHYNPESWNYVEDPYNEGQGAALQRKLAASQKYRFRHWRMLSSGAVLQFKQTLSAGFPVYTGVLVTDDWDGKDVHRTGVIPLSKLFWAVRVMPPPMGLVAMLLEENGIDPDSAEAEQAVAQISMRLIRDTIGYVSSKVFKCDCSVADAHECEGGIELVMVLEGKICGGHALCLAGYADDPSYPGGGYFIARNSWSDSKWAPESPEMPGYALLPYAYVADLAQEGVAMSEVPDTDVAPCDGTPPRVAAGGGMRMNAFAAGSVAGAAASIGATRKSWLDALRRRSAADRAAVETTPFAQPHSAAAPSELPIGMPASTEAGFEEWLAARRSVLQRPARDKSGVLLRPGTPVLVPDPANPGNILCDMPENRTRMRAMFEAEVKTAWDAAEKERLAQEAAAAAEKAKRLARAVRETADGMLALGKLSVSLARFRESLVLRHEEFAETEPGAIRTALLELQKSAHDKYAVCSDADGTEMFRKATAIGNSRRILD